MAERYFVVEVEGDESFLRGFVEGYSAARALDAGGVYFGSDYGLDDESFLANLQEFFGLKTEHNLLLVRESVLADLERALSVLREKWNVSLKGKKEVLEVRYAFSAKTASRELASRLKTLLSSLPKGARVEGLSFTEVQMDEQFETAAYAPEHPYEYRVTGVLCGEIEATLEAYRLLAEIENVEWEKPELILAETDFHVSIEKDNS